MRKYIYKNLGLIFLMPAIMFTSCEKTPTVKERITDLGVKVNLKSKNGKYLSSNWDNFIYADKKKASTWENFDIFLKEDKKYAILAYTGKYLSANLENKKEIESNRDKYNSWEKFEIEEINDSTIALKAFNNKYISVNDNDMRLYAVADTITDSEQFIVIFKQN